MAWKTISVLLIISMITFAKFSVADEEPQRISQDPLFSPPPLSTPIVSTTPTTPIVSTTPTTPIVLTTHTTPIVSTTPTTPSDPTEPYATTICTPPPEPIKRCYWKWPGENISYAKCVPTCGLFEWKLSWLRCWNGMTCCSDFGSWLYNELQNAGL